MRQRKSLLIEKLKRKLKLKENTCFLVYDGEVRLKELQGFWQFIFKKINRDPNRPFVMIITTTGGSFDAARDFYAKIKFYGVSLTTVAVGSSLSAGITLVLAGQTRLAAKHTQFLFHQSPIDGQNDMDPSEVKRLLAQSEQCDREELAILSRNLNIGHEEIKKMVDQETYFSEDMAQKIGLVHQII